MYCVVVDTRELLVFVASPSDVDNERETVRRVADKVNAALGAELGLRLRVTGWEDVPPDLGRPQSQINPLVEECDIFIGVLSRRWGRNTGTHTSGFQEEFELAVTRRADGQVPAVAVYFKVVPADVLADPGPELRRVLEFQSRLRDEHQALYHEFHAPADLETALMTFLIRHLARAAKPTIGQGPEGTVSGGPVNPRAPEGVTLDEARQELAATLGAFEALVRGAPLEARLDLDRLLLFAESIQPEPGLLPPHPANRLYERRMELHLSIAERGYWLRSLAADVATSRSTGWARVLPGWYVLTAGPSGVPVGLENDLVEAIADDNENVADGALLLLTQLGARPDALWTLRDNAAEARSSDSPNAVSAPERWASLLAKPGRRDASIAYLLRVGTSDDSGLLDQIAAGLGDKNADEFVAVQEYLNGDPDPFVTSLVSSYSTHPWQQEILLAHLDRLPADSVRALAKQSYYSDELRAAALQELLARNELDESVVLAFLKSENLCDAIFVELGRSNAAVSVNMILAALARLDDANLKFDLSARLRGCTSSLSDLEARLDQPWSGVDAWNAISWSGFVQEVLEKAREVLDTNADSFVAGLTMSDVSDPERILDFLRAQARVAALRVLSRSQPNGIDAGDVERVRAELLRDDWASREEALLCLAVVGEQVDVPDLLAGLERVYSSRARSEILGAALRLGRLDVARALVSSKDSWKAIPAADYIAGSTPTDVPDAELVELLYNEKAPVRIVALEGLQARWTREQLENLLNRYSDRPSGYYYNVVSELDRLLYAPNAIAEISINRPLA